MFDTRNDLPPNTRIRVVELLNARLADAIDLGAADDLGDADTADLFTGISRETDKQLWFLEAHLHGRL
jgi:DNA-binding ferritin-like protein